MDGTKVKIFDSAVKVFSEKGFDGATMDEIAKTANVAKGTLYYHFKSKEDIFSFLAEEGMQIIKAEIYARIGGINDAVEKLKQVIIFEMEIVYKYNAFINMIISQIWKDNEREKITRKWLFQYIDIIGDIIDEGAQKGIFKVIDKKFLATAVFGVISSISLYRIMSDDSASKEEMSEIATEYILNGIKIQ